MNITVADLDNNVALDSQAMTGVLGGWHSHGSSTSYSPVRATGWSRWMKTGLPFTYRRYRDLYRTKKITIRQHKRVWQYRAKISIGF